MNSKRYNELAKKIFEETGLTPEELQKSNIDYSNKRIRRAIESGDPKEIENARKAARFLGALPEIISRELND